MVTSTRSKSVKIEDPVTYFAGWAFRIDAHHYETLGLGYRQFMKDKRPTWSWAVMEPIEYCFEVGYIFHNVENPKRYLQIAADWDAFHIEVHEGFSNLEKSRKAFAVRTQELAEWLKTGIRPRNVKSLDIPSSKAGLLAWQISNEPDSNDLFL